MKSGLPYARIYDKILELEDDEYDATVGRIPCLARSLGVTLSPAGVHHLCITPKWWKVEGTVRMMKKAIDLASAIGAPTVASYMAGFYDPPAHMLREILSPYLNRAFSERICR